MLNRVTNNIPIHLRFPHQSNVHQPTHRYAQASASGENPIKVGDYAFPIDMAAAFYLSSRRSQFGYGCETALRGAGSAGLASVTIGLAGTTHLCPPIGLGIPVTMFMTAAACHKTRFSRDRWFDAKSLKRGLKAELKRTLGDQTFSQIQALGYDEKGLGSLLEILEHRQIDTKSLRHAMRRELPRESVDMRQASSSHDDAPSAPQMGLPV